MPYDPEEEARWAVNMRLTDLEDRLDAVERGPYMCPLCTTPYNSREARNRCDCDED